MRKAYLAIDESERKLVDADEVDYSDYSRIFQCPRCNAALTLRKGFSREGHWIHPTFVHPEGELDDCKFRVTFNTASSNQSIFDLIEKGQSSKKLEQTVIKCLQRYKAGKIPSILEKYSEGRITLLNDELHLKRQIIYNETPGNVYSEPTLFIRASSKVLSSAQSYQYIDCEIEKFEEWLKSSQQAIDYFSERENLRRGSIPIGRNIKYHCRQLRGITKYICRGASENCREKLLRIIIWGDQKLPVSEKQLWTKRELQMVKQFSGKEKEDDTKQIEQRRKPQIELMKKFGVQDLRRICEEPQFLRVSFSEFYQNRKSPSSEFIEFVLSKTLESIKFYDWSILPNYYS